MRQLVAAACLVVVAAQSAPHPPSIPCAVCTSNKTLPAPERFNCTIAWVAASSNNIYNVPLNAAW